MKHGTGQLLTDSYNPTMHHRTISSTFHVTPPQARTDLVNVEEVLERVPRPDEDGSCVLVLGDGWVVGVGLGHAVLPPRSVVVEAGGVPSLAQQGVVAVGV